MKTNIIILEALGYKQVKCNNGLAWESPHVKCIDDIFNVHGRLLIDEDNFYKFHSSWDWLIPAYHIICTAIWDSDEKYLKKLESLITAFNSCVQRNAPIPASKTLVKIINRHSSNILSEKHHGKNI